MSTEHTENGGDGIEFADTTPTADALVSEQAETPEVAWAPAPPRKRRRWPWIAVPAAGVVAGLVITSTVLIAPGVSAAGVPIGGLTRDAAAETIASKLAATTIELTTPAGTATLSASELGTSIDAAALADEAHANYPLWNIAGWNADQLDGVITIDQATATKALEAALPEAYLDPTEATVVFEDGGYHVTEAATGTGIDLDSVRTALQQALGAGEATAKLDAEPTVIDPLVTTEEAQQAADTLNAITADAGFYVGDERTVPLDAATVASWITYTVGDDGSVAVTADAAKINEVVPSLAGQVDREPHNGTAIVDRGGAVLREGDPAVDGRKLGSTASIAKDFAAQLADHNGKFVLPVTVTEATVTGITRWIDVNLSTQRVIAWENGQQAMNVAVSTGVNGWETHTGEFRTNSRIYKQDMGCVDGYEWCTRDVPYVMFFNGDEGFHGTYWHNNFGTPMSHGCVNLTVGDAEWLFNWAPVGTEVSVHY